MIYYSPATGGFYHDEVHEVLPDDCLEIEPERHAALLEAQSTGKAIMPGPDGRPIAAERQATPEEAMFLLRRRRDSLLRQSDHTQALDYPLNPEQRAAWQAYRQSLRDLPASFAANSGEIIWPDAPQL